MSLLDDVSIVVTPNGYKAEELYAVIPVPTEGAELVTNGDFATDSDWNKTGTWSIENNYATANGNSTSQYIQQDFTITNAKIYLFTYEIIENTLNGNGASLSGSGGFVSVSLSSVIGTHQVYITADDSGAAYALKIGVSGTATTGTIKLDNVSVKEYTSADMDVTRATDATRVNESGLIADVLSNVPRIDYTGGGCPHILAEPQRTNLVTYSSDFTTWTTTGSAEVTPNTTISPDGTQNADTLNIFSGNFFYKPITSGAGTFTLSCYVKVASGTLDFKMQSFNGTDGADASSTFTANTNWQRFEFTTTVTTDSNFYPIQVSGLTGGDFQIWGAQVEEGSYPTSYIPNFGTLLGVTRNQDIFTRDGIGSLINSTEGVLFVEMAALSNDLTYREISLSDGTSTNRVEIRYGTSSNSIQAIIRNGSYVILQHNLSTIVDSNKVAFKWKTGDFALWINGVEVATDTTAFVTSGLNRLAFDQGTTGNTFFGKVKQLQVYNTALTDEQLTSLTS